METVVSALVVGVSLVLVASNAIAKRGLCDHAPLYASAKSGEGEMLRVASDRESVNVLGADIVDFGQFVANRPDLQRRRAESMANHPSQHRRAN